MRVCKYEYVLCAALSFLQDKKSRVGPPFQELSRYLFSILNLKIFLEFTLKARCRFCYRKYTNDNCGILMFLIQPRANILMLGPAPAPLLHAPSVRSVKIETSCSVEVASKMIVHKLYLLMDLLYLLYHHWFGG